MSFAAHWLFFLDFNLILISRKPRESKSPKEKKQKEPKPLKEKTPKK